MFYACQFWSNLVSHWSLRQKSSVALFYPPAICIWSRSAANSGDCATEMVKVIRDSTILLLPSGELFERLGEISSEECRGRCILRNPCMVVAIITQLPTPRGGDGATFCTLLYYSRRRVEKSTSTLVDDGQTFSLFEKRVLGKEAAGGTKEVSGIVKGTIVLESDCEKLNGTAW